MRKTVLLLASTALIVLLAGMVALLAMGGPARAAFPGKNGEIAFVSSRDGNEEIYVMNADGTNPTRLTTEPRSDVHPAFSPDGKQLTFTTFDKPAVIDEIYMMDAKDVDPKDGNGDHPTNITGNPPGTPSFQSVFSPDGSRIAFVHNEDAFRNEIYVMNLDGTNLERLTNNTANDSRPVFSPDGTKIAFQRREPDSPDRSKRGNDIYVMNADGTDQTRLTTDRVADSNPNFSPDGTKIAFDSARNGNLEIYIMNMDGTDQTRLTTDPNTDEFPAFSPDGNQLTFSSDRDGNFEIYAMSADGTGIPSRLTETESPVGNTEPNWGPFLYDFNGFYEPVNNLPTTNVLNAGRAVPVNFSLGDDQGLGIFAADYPKSQRIDCDSTAPIDILEQTATAGDSGLSYDAATGQYTYVWKTEKGWDGTCRQFVLKLDDLTVHRANFEFK
jgi:Tol biopolymer transport system component